MTEHHIIELENKVNEHVNNDAEFRKQVMISLVNLSETQKKMDKKMDEIWDFFQGMGFISKFLLKVGGLAGAAGAVIFLIIQIKSLFK